MHSSKPSSPGFPRPAGYGILARHTCKPCSLESTETAPAATGPDYRQTPLQEIHQAYERFSCWTEKILSRIFFARPLGRQKRGGRGGDQESKDLRGEPDHELVGDQGLIIRRQALTLLVRRHVWLQSVALCVCLSPSAVIFQRPQVSAMIWFSLCSFVCENRKMVTCMMGWVLATLRSCELLVALLQAVENTRPWRFCIVLRKAFRPVVVAFTGKYVLGFEERGYCRREGCLLQLHICCWCYWCCRWSCCKGSLSCCCQVGAAVAVLQPALFVQQQTAR